MLRDLTAEWQRGMVGKIVSEEEFLCKFPTLLRVGKRRESSLGFLKRLTVRRKATIRFESRIVDAFVSVSKRKQRFEKRKEKNIQSRKSKARRDSRVENAKWHCSCTEGRAQCGSRKILPSCSPPGLTTLSSRGRREEGEWRSCRAEEKEGEKGENEGKIG